MGKNNQENFVKEQKQGQAVICICNLLKYYEATVFRAGQHPLRSRQFTGTVQKVNAEPEPNNAAASGPSPTKQGPNFSKMPML